MPSEVRATGTVTILGPDGLQWSCSCGEGRKGYKDETACRVAGTTHQLSHAAAARQRGRNNKMRGKSIERRVAKLLTRLRAMPFNRNPDNGTKVADIESHAEVVEVKSMQRATPPILRRAWLQAEAAREETGKEPRVVLSYVDDNRRTFWLVTKLIEPEEGSNDE